MNSEAVNTPDQLDPFHEAVALLTMEYLRDLKLKEDPTSGFALEVVFDWAKNHRSPVIYGVYHLLFAAVDSWLNTKRTHARLVSEQLICELEAAGRLSPYDVMAAVEFVEFRRAETTKSNWTTTWHKICSRFINEA